MARPNITSKVYDTPASPIIITKPNTGGANTEKDWIRAAAGTAEFTINDQPLRELIKPYLGQDGNSVNIKDFFRKVLLKDFKGSNKADIEEAMVENMIKILHQGGILNLASASLASSLIKDKPGKCGFSRVSSLPDANALKQLAHSQYFFVTDAENPSSKQIYYYNKENENNPNAQVLVNLAGSEGEWTPTHNEECLTFFNRNYPKDVVSLSIAQKRQLDEFTGCKFHTTPILSYDSSQAITQRHITTTPTGFKIEETFQIKQIGKVDKDGTLFFGDNGPEYFTAQNPEEDLIEGHAIVSVDFDKTGKPNLKAEQNMITYRNEDVRSLLDTRWTLQKLIDDLLYVLGFNRAVTYKNPEKTTKEIDSQSITPQSESESESESENNDEEDDDDENNKPTLGM